MTTKISIDSFLSQNKLAVVGASRSNRKFGNTVFKDLKNKGYKVYPVNVNAEEIEGEKCYPDINSLPEPVDGVVFVVPPHITELIVNDTIKAGIKHVWMQQGSESFKAIQSCKENDVNVIIDECILMFTKPTGFIHKIHRGINGLVGKLPK